MRLSGLVSVVLIVGTGLATNGGYLPEADEIKEFFDDNTWTLGLAVYGMALAAQLLALR